MELQDHWDEAVHWLELYSGLRTELMAELRDEDLRYSLPGNNPSLGELCLEMGEVELSYLDSFATFRQSFDHHHPDKSVAGEVEGLRSWFEELDTRLFKRLNEFPSEKLADTKIDRGENFQVDPVTQAHIYREALLIFYGKVSTYLKAMQKEIPGRWEHWIG